jgi:Uma2 family endonuclease
MATAPKPARKTVEKPYPTSNGRVVPESQFHKLLMTSLWLTLREFFRPQENIFVGGDMLLFYERGNRRRHVAPDIFVVKGVPGHVRQNYLLWQEGVSPQVVIEVTSKTTRREDQTTKLALYRDVLRVKEYFLFDMYEDWLFPSLQGYRLWRGRYRPIEPVHSRLPSREAGLHLERNGIDLRLWNPATGRWLPTQAETLAQAQAEAASAQARAESAQAVAEMSQAVAATAQDIAESERLARERAEAEIARLRQELDELRRPRG